MIDIIDQLRERTENIDVIFEAADEIESLRSELEQAKVDKVALQKVAFTAQEMAKEIAELAEAEAASLRSELAEAKARPVYRSDEHGALVCGLRKELAAKDGIVASLNERSAQYERDCIAKDARIAELEARCKASSTS